MVCCSVHLPYLRHVQMEKYTIHADENGSICFWETRCDVYIPFDNGHKRERENENGKNAWNIQLVAEWNLKLVMNKKTNRCSQNVEQNFILAMKWKVNWKLFCASPSSNTDFNYIFLVCYGLCIDRIVLELCFFPYNLTISSCCIFDENLFFPYWPFAICWKYHYTVPW